MMIEMLTSGVSRAFRTRKSGGYTNATQPQAKRFSRSDPAVLSARIRLADFALTATAGSLREKRFACGCVGWESATALPGSKMWMKTLRSRYC